jgi:hypothetical protein
MAKKFIKFVVTGRTSFPLDMLRHDCCWPTRSDDVLAIAESVQKYGGSDQRVELTSIQPPTDGRWSSFGWRVANVAVAR